MSNLISVLPTSTLPRFEAGCDRHLAGAIVPRAQLTLADRREMYALLEAYFCGTHRARFEADLDEKETVILLRDTEFGRIQGFSTSMRLFACVHGEPLVAFFSGDTIVAREYWGESLLSRLWGQMVFAEAGHIVAAQPRTRVYWFLICSGYRTWRFLPIFFRDFYPNRRASAPSPLKPVIDILGQQKFGDQYLPDLGVVRFRSATPLRHGVGEVTDRRLRDPNVEFFTRMNPGHESGDELACLAEISRSNLTRAGERMMAATVKC